MRRIFSADAGATRGWPELARRVNAVLLVPNAVNPDNGDPQSDNQSWNDLRQGVSRISSADDVGFITGLLDWANQTYRTDRSRVYVTGASNGGMMTYRLLCERTDLFAAGAGVIANLSVTLKPACKPSRPVPVLIMNGTADKLVPYDGKPGQVLGTDETARFWRAHNGCNETAVRTWLPDRDPNDGSKVERIDFACPPSQSVVLYRIAEGGHQMPSLGNDFAAEIILGRRNHDIEAAEEIWAFFKRFVH